MMKREYRAMNLILPDEGENKFIVEGYASTYTPYLLGTVDGVDYYERIEPTAFDNTDLTDVVFRVDHTGPVYARSSAGTVKLNPDEHGLHNVTDLSRTQRSREVHADIKAGNYPQMSFAFTVAEGGDYFDRETRTRVITNIKKVYDISPVTFPANPDTVLSARDYINGVIDAEKAERLEAELKERRRKQLALKLKIMGV